MQASTSSSMSPMESTDGLGLTGSLIGEAGAKRQVSSSTKGASTVTRVHNDSATETIESETPKVSALCLHIHLP